MAAPPRKFYDSHSHLPEGSPGKEDPSKQKLRHLCAGVQKLDEATAHPTSTTSAANFKRKVAHQRTILA